MKTVAIACLAVAASAQGSIRVRPTSKAATQYSKADLARGRAAVAATGATAITGTINAMGPQVFFGGNDYDNILKDDFSSLITSTMVATTLDAPVFPTYEAPVTMPAPAPVVFEVPVTMPAPAPVFEVPVTFPSYTPPVETFTFPSETFTFPTYTPPAVETFTFPTYTPPAVETFTFPTYTPPAPVYTPPVYTPPAPVYTPPAPVYTPPAPVYTPPVVTSSWETEWTSTPIYTSPVETFTFTPPVAPVETFTWDFPTYTPPVVEVPVYTPPVYTPPAFTETFTFPVVPGAVDYGMTGPGETIVYASTSPSEFKPNIKGTGGPRTMSTMYGF